MPYPYFRLYYDPDGERRSLLALEEMGQSGEEGFIEWLHSQDRPWRSHKLLPKALQAYPRFQTCPAVLGRYLEAAVMVAKRTTASLRACAMLPRTLEEMRARVFQNPCDISELLLVPRDVVDKFLQSTFEWRECRLRSSDRS